MNFSNYNLVAIHKQNIIDFCKKLYQQYKEMQSGQKQKNYDTINISVNNLYYMFDPTEIQLKVGRYNIDYIPSYRIDTIEDITLIILNPTNTGINFLHELQLERNLRLNYILNELLSSYNIYLDLKLIQALHAIKMCEITEVHLCYYILDLIQRKEIDYQYTNITSIYENILKPIYDEIPLRKYKYSDVIPRVFDETIILANPDEHRHLISEPELNGIICKPNLDANDILIAKNHGKEIFPGTGELI